MDFSKFKKLKSDDKHTVLRHPRGHSITIAHKGLPDHVVEQLKSAGEPNEQPVQRFADGGGVKSLQEVLGGDDSSPTTSGASSWFPETQTAPHVDIPQRQPLIQLDPNTGAQVGGPSLHQPQQQLQQPPQSSPQANAAADGAMDPMQAMMRAQGQQRAGIQSEAKALDTQGKAESQILGDQATRLQNVQNEYQTHFNTLDQERQGFQQDLMNGHIDPNHYINSMSSGAKVMSVLGLMMGGMASQFNGGHNVAMEILNKHIDQDIEAQKADLGKKETLLQANLHQFGNLKDATDMTKIMMNDIVSAKLKQTAAQAQGPIAKARAQQALGQLDAANAPLMQQMAMRRLAMGGANGQPSQIDPADLVQYLVPKEHQKDVATQIDQAKNARNLEGQMMDAFEKARTENTIMRTGAGMLRTPESVIKLNALALPMIHDAEGRVNEFEQKTLQDTFPQPGDSEAKINAKKQTLQAFIQQKKQASLARSFGLNLDNFQTTATPRSVAQPQYKTVNGVKYMRGPNGEAVPVK